MRFIARQNGQIVAYITPLVYSFIATFQDGRKVPVVTLDQLRADGYQVEAYTPGCTPE